MAVKTFCDRCESELIKDNDRRETVEGPKEREYLLCEPCLVDLDRFFHNEAIGARQTRITPEDRTRALRLGFIKPVEFPKP